MILNVEEVFEAMFKAIPDDNEMTDVEDGDDGYDNKSSTERFGVSFEKESGADPDFFARVYPEAIYNLFDFKNYVIKIL
jgi:hypothetical protein